MCYCVNGSFVVVFFVFRLMRSTNVSDLVIIRGLRYDSIEGRATLWSDWSRLLTLIYEERACQSFIHCFINQKVKSRIARISMM